MSVFVPGGISILTPLVRLNIIGPILSTIKPGMMSHERAFNCRGMNLSWEELGVQSERCGKAESLDDY